MSARADLRGPLSARLLPVLAVVAAAIALSAPLAFHWMGASELRESASATASRIGEILGREAEQRPVLWRYDSIRLLEHLRSYQDRPHVARIEVVDARGVLLDPGASLDDGGLLWSSAPITVRERVVGRAWVGMSPASLRARSLTLLAAFLALALGLAGGVYAIAMRSARRAEARIDELVDGLARARVEQRVRAFGVRAVAAQEEDRRAIARDLHDSVGQALTAIRIQAELLAGGATQPEKVATLAKKVADTSDATIEEVRRAIARLGPAVLDELGLAAALGRLLEDVRDAGLEVEASFPDDLTGLPAAIETTCYRIAQDALTNVTRHAQATKARLVLARIEDALVLEVQDDGRGRREGDVPGHGLRTMRERAELLGGSLVLEPVTPSGTLLRAQLPLGDTLLGRKSSE